MTAAAAATDNAGRTVAASVMLVGARAPMDARGVNGTAQWLMWLESAASVPGRTDAPPASMARAWTACAAAGLGMAA